MYVKSLMSKRVFTVNIDDSLLDVKALLESSKLPHLLVLEDFKLVGVISDRDYLKATGPALGSAAETAHDRAALQKRVHQVMTRNPVTLTPDDTVIDAIKIFNTKFVSSIPIINEQHRPVGTLSWFDILKALDPDYKDALSTIFTEEPTKDTETLNTEMKQTAVQIQKLAHGEGLDMPFYATAHAAGADLRAAIGEDITLQPGEHQLIKTGFAMALAEGYEAQVRPRSGLAYKHGITVLNSPGTIDADYRGEVGVILINHGKEPFVITRGERIAQMIIASFVQGSFSEVNELSETVRGEGGFGSSGRK